VKSSMQHRRWWSREICGLHRSEEAITRSNTPVRSPPAEREFARSAMQGRGCSKQALLFEPLLSHEGAKHDARLVLARRTAKM
jgi:hypothetical protein